MKTLVWRGKVLGAGPGPRGSWPSAQHTKLGLEGPVQCPSPLGTQGVGFRQPQRGQTGRWSPASSQEPVSTTGTQRRRAGMCDCGFMNTVPPGCRPTPSQARGRQGAEYRREPDFVTGKHSPETLGPAHPQGSVSRGDLKENLGSGSRSGLPKALLGLSHQPVRPCTVTKSDREVTETAEVNPCRGFL